jgi:hypothetical protein
MAENWLKEYGFNVVGLPRRDLYPADVLLRSNGRFDEKAGDLGMVFTYEEELPRANAGEPVAAILRTIDREVELNFGLKVLGALVGVATAGKFGAAAAAKHATRLTVTYEAVEQDSIAVLALDSWIQLAKPKVTGQSAIWLNNNKLAAITAVLRTATLSVIAQRQDGASVELTMPEIQGIVGGEASVNKHSASSTAVTFTGKQPIVFGFQAYVMKFAGNVAFGIDPVRRRKGPAPEQFAWTIDDEVELSGDGKRLSTPDA